ncbi:MAG: 3-oxoacyl-ACP reductase FabG [Faecalibacterium sp.]|jgi:3-oxoacyl-[acyl-carrier protein] reductase|nr:3-oxoacyl-ACP reductase FabG [Faecalibacterium sp.]
MKDDDFELSLFPEESEPDEDTLPEKEKPAAFDWQRDDPEDFSHHAPAPQKQPAPPQDFAQPLFVQDTFGRQDEAVPAPRPESFAQPAAPRPAENNVRPAPAAAVPQEKSAQPHTRTPNGRTVLISGGDRGIGAAAARLFWQQGYATAILYHQDEGAARNLINALGRDCMAVRCDVADRAACEAALRVVVRTFGDPDVLICNAGIAQQKLFTDITEEEWQRMLAVDLTGAFHLCQLVLPGMIRRKHGRILNVSSMWGQAGGSCEVHYSAAKAGLIGLTKALAKEEGPSGITVNCVAPGVIETDMMNAFSVNDKKALAEETPVGRLGEAAEVARVLAFLAEEDAGYITGQVFGVNGGLVI